MPSRGFDSGDTTREKARRIRERLIAKGLNPRGNGFMRAFFKAMRKS